MPEQIGGTPNNIGIAKIKVLGLGGGGSNAVSRMYRDRLPDMEYMIINTDAQALVTSDVPIRLRVGDSTARGMGVGGDPRKGQMCAEEDRDRILELVEGADMVFLAAGMGGGTGTGIAPTIAEIARDTGALTVGVVTKPFSFEGHYRMDMAIAGIKELQGRVDTLITIPNDALLEIADEEMTMEQAFRMADSVLQQGVQSIAQVVTVAGDINLDFADIRAVMSNAGPAWMAIGKGVGANRAVKAAEQAIQSPLLDVSLEGARGVVFNFTGGPGLTVNEVHEAADVISAVVHPDANIIFGMVTDPNLMDEVHLTLIATGFPAGNQAFGRDDAIDEEIENLDIPPFLRAHPAARRRARSVSAMRGSAGRAIGA